MLAVADEEVLGFESRLRTLDVDLVLAAGDLPWPYLEQIVQALDVPAAFVPGNHDPDTGALARGVGPQGFVDVDGRVADVAGLRVAGLGGCVRYKPGPHQYTQEEYTRRGHVLAGRAGGPVDVLLTHAPPLELGDGPDPPHQGIAALHDVLKALRPRWHLHGHIHPHGMRKPDRQVAGTTIRNVIPWRVLDVEALAVTQEV